MPKKIPNQPKQNIPTSRRKQKMPATVRQAALLEYASRCRNMGPDIDAWEITVYDTQFGILTLAYVNNRYNDRFTLQITKEDMEKLVSKELYANVSIAYSPVGTSNIDANQTWYSKNSTTTMGVFPQKTEQDQLTEALAQAQTTIKEQNAVLESIQKEPLLLFSVDRISRDGKHAFIKKGDQTFRLEVVKDLQPRDEVLCHPKTMQIVERVGKPPLEVSRFAPDSVPNVTWDDIGGLELVKRDMIEAIEMPHKHKDLFKYYNKRPVKGILLAGPPGCGKTMLGKAAANSLANIYGQEKSRTGFLYVKGPEILNMYVGASEETVRDLFYDARQHHEEHGYPAVIFIDEADSVMAARGGRFGGMSNTIVPMFLTEMDGLEESSAIVILATNRPDILDPAVIREGRIDRKIMVTRPSVKDAENIIRMNLIRYPLCKDFDIDAVSEDMAKEFYSNDRMVVSGKILKDIVNGAMLASCIDIAVSQAVHRDLASGSREGLMPEDLLQAIDRIQHQNRFVVHDMEEAA